VPVDGREKHEGPSRVCTCVCVVCVVVMGVVYVRVCVSMCACLWMGVRSTRGPAGCAPVCVLFVRL